MGLGHWFRKRLRGKRPPDGMVPFLDTQTKKVVRIPASELRPGTVKAQVQGIDEPVWVLPENLQPGEIRHPAFDEEVRDMLREIRSAFAEHYPLTLEEWEDGFRRDANPAREIALWSHAADIYTEFAADEPSPERRHDVYLCLTTCMVTGPDDVWHVLRPQVLTRTEAERVVARFYGRE